MQSPKRACTLTLFVSAALPPLAVRAETPVVKRTLDNGLVVLVREQHASPVVAVRVYVKTGSIYEGPYCGSGLSHLFEHVLSEGTTTRTKEQINQTMEEIGNQHNAYTTKDHTCYYITTASRFFDKALDVLSDEIRNASFAERGLSAQRGVIHNEMNMKADEPEDVLSELFYYTMWQRHPVRYPVIGYREVFDKLTREDIVSYYRSNYVPENVVVAIAGDVSTADVLTKVEKALGDWPRGTASERLLPQEPRQMGIRRAVREKAIKLTYMMMGFHTVGIDDPEVYPLDLLAAIVGHGRSSRLFRRVKEQKQLVHSVSAWSLTPSYGAGAFIVKAVLDPQNLEEAENAIVAELRSAADRGVSPGELAKAKRQAESDFVFSRQTAEQQAAALASDELATGNPEFSSFYVDRIRATTGEQVRAVARKYFTFDSYTVAIVRPKSPSAVAPAAPEERAGAWAKRRFSNGMTVLARRSALSPTVSMVATFLGGTRYESEKDNGVSSLATELLIHGTARHTGDQLAEIVEGLGGRLDSRSGNNSLSVSAEFLKQDFKTGLSLLAEVLLEPTFPPEEVDRAKTAMLAALKEQESDPFSIAGEALRKALFPGHPYQLNRYGTPGSVRDLTPAKVSGFYRSFVRPDAMTLAVVGDLEPEGVIREVEKALGKWEGKAGKVSVPAGSPLTGLKKVDLSKAGLAQSIILYGFRGMTVGSSDQYAMDVLDAAISGITTPGGRLHERLRGDQLVYVVHAFNQLGLDPGCFGIYAATTKERVSSVRQIIEEELGRAASELLPAEELRRAKNMCIASHETKLQTNAAQAQQAAYDELYGLGCDFSQHYAERIEAVTAEEVQVVARKYLDLNRCVLVVLTPDESR